MTPLRKLLFAAAMAAAFSPAWINLYLDKMMRYDTEWIPSMKGDECVVLVHGLFRSQKSMKAIARELAARGYGVLNFGYNSRSKTMDEIAGDLHVSMSGIPRTVKKIHFVTHSLGSIVVRNYLANYGQARKGRFVMIAPPNQGSSWGALLVKHIPFARDFFGKPFQEIDTVIARIHSLPDVEIGVIAGGTGTAQGMNPFISGDNDMTIGVHETVLSGMRDFIVIKGQHSLLLNHGKVIENVLKFLKDGIFQK